MVIAEGAPFASHGDWHNLFKGDFWYYWLTEPLGLGLDYSLGADYDRFLDYPAIGGRPTMLVWGLLLIGIVAGVSLLASFVLGTILRRRLQAPCPKTKFTLAVGFIGYGLAMTLPGLLVQRFYLLVLLSLPYVGWAWLAINGPPRFVGRVALIALWAAQLGLTICFLSFIHENGGAERGDYGVSYRLQPP
jgi:hypothetical protein